jgi:hypothetical protein
MGDAALPEGAALNFGQSRRTEVALCGIDCGAFAYRILLSIKPESRQLLHTKPNCSLGLQEFLVVAAFQMLAHQVTIGGTR